MNVGEVLETVEQSLLSRQLSSLERLILCHSWLGRGYSEMASDSAYSIAHIKEIGSQLWQAFSKALGERVTKKNLFLVLKQYLLSQTGETLVSDQLSVTLELVEVIDTPLTLTTNQLPVTTDLVEASYSEDSEQLSLICDRGFLVTEDSSQLERAPQECQTSTDNTEAVLIIGSRQRALATILQEAYHKILAKNKVLNVELLHRVVMKNLPTFPTLFIEKSGLIALTRLSKNRKVERGFV
jgi:hypothetical protein